MKNTKKIVALLLTSVMLVLALAGCQSTPEAAQVKEVYNAQPAHGTWTLFGDLEFTNVRTQQVQLYSDGTYVLQDVTYEMPLFNADPSESEGMPFGANVISATSFGTYTLVEDEESEGKAILTLSAANRLIFSGSDVFFPDSYGFYDSADKSTAEAFSANTLYGSDTAKLMADFGSEKVIPVNTQTKLMDVTAGDPIYQQGHITFNQSVN